MLANLGLFFVEPSTPCMHFFSQKYDNQIELEQGTMHVNVGVCISKNRDRKENNRYMSPPLDQISYAGMVKKWTPRRLRMGRSSDQYP